MQKRFALFFIILIFALLLFPAYAPADETLSQSSSLSDVYSQLFTAAGTSDDITHNHGWTGVSLSWDIAYQLPQYVPASTATRAPPA